MDAIAREFVLSVGSADRHVGRIGEVRVRLDAEAAALVRHPRDLSLTLAGCVDVVSGGAAEVLHVYEVRRPHQSKGDEG